MRGEVDSGRLAELVVRIDRTDDKPLGTGFFVAPGWVLTCAHVVSGLDEVSVAPHAGGGPLRAEVRARSAAPPKSRKLWPFPDLALVELSDPFQHRCVLLEDVDPGDEQELVAWGYAGWEDEVVPQGSAAKLQFLGREGDGFLGLKGDVVRGGLSGSPLVCPQRRAVVGVVTATRGPARNLGGWASPVGALKGGPEIDDRLATLGRQVLAENRAAVLADRANWHAVIRVPNAENVLQEMVWPRYVKGDRPDPADLLLAEYGVVPLLIGVTKLKNLMAWCLASPPMSVGVVSGFGGSGKTRIAMELCRELDNGYGWISGELLELDDTRIADISAIILPRLVIVDYAEAAQPAKIRTLLDSLRRSASDVAPVRVVLLVRLRPGTVNAAARTIGAVREGSSGHVRRLLDNREEVAAINGPLDARSRRVLYESAVASFAEAWKSSEPSGPTPSLAGPSYTEPLGVLYEALLAVLDIADTQVAEPDDDFWDRTPAERLLRHEEKYWLLAAPSEDREVLRQAVALATLLGGSGLGELDPVLQVIPGLDGEQSMKRREALMTWLSTLYRGPHAVNPLRPDRLGEALVARGVLVRYPPLLTSILSRADNKQLSHALAVLGRCMNLGVDVADAIIAAVNASHEDLARRAEAEQLGPANQLGGRELSSAMADLLTKIPLSDLVVRE